MSEKILIPDESPAYVVPEDNLVPASNHLNSLATIPPSRMFLIKKSLKVYQEKNPGSAIYDASQGDGGASLPGVAPEILQKAAQLQYDHGTGYDMPFGTPAFRETVVEDYWQLDASLGFGPQNVVGTVGGRDALVKAYQAMLSLGTGQAGDFIVVSRVPWISYNWGPYGIGANVMLAPGSAEESWKYTPEGIKACVDLAAKSGRKVAGLVITCPDNPTGRTISMEEQVELGRYALKIGVAYVLFDWIYHYVTDEETMDLNKFLGMFTPEERKRIMVMDGLTKSLGASNIRSAHLIASEEVTKFIVARASHNVIPPYFSLAVAQAAYQMGYSKACSNIVEPTNASRKVLKSFLDENKFEYIIGKGYYAFINVGEWLQSKGWKDTELMGQYLAEENGLAVVPGAFFSSFGGDWIRYSYATPAEKTLGAAQRLIEGLKALEK